MSAPLPAHRLFFPLGAGFAALSVPAWVGMRAGLLPPVGSTPVVWHGHEMLFGFAGAAMAGFLVTHTSRPLLSALLGAWLAARAASVLGGWWSYLALPFALLFAAITAPAFLRRAKAWSNAPFVLVPAGLLVAELAFGLEQSGIVEADGRALLLASDGVLLLLVVMGGRITRTSTAGLARSHRQTIGSLGRGLESLSALLLLAHAALALSGGPSSLSGFCSLAAGGIGLLRLARWWTGAIVHAPEVAGLHLGCLWLGLGLVLAGLGEAGLAPDPSTGLHAAVVGGLGSLAFAVFVRTTLQRERLPIEAGRRICRLLPFLSLAACFRIAADLLPEPLHLPALAASASSWSAAFGSLALWLLVGPVGRRGRTRSASAALPGAGMTDGRATRGPRPRARGRRRQSAGVAALGAPRRRGWSRRHKGAEKARHGLAAGLSGRRDEPY